MLRFSIVACAVCGLLAVGCGKKDGEGTSSTSSTAPTGSGQKVSPEQAASVVNAFKALVPQPESAPDESTGASESYVPAVAEDESKTPQLTVDQLTTNPALFDRKYALREIELAGVVVKTGRDEGAGGVESVWLGTGPGGSDSSIICHFKNAAEVAKLAKGKRTAVRGRVMRNFVQSLEDCEPLNRDTP